MSNSFSGATLADHQRTAAVRIIELLRRYRGALLADEVGMGKSFVAAAVAAHFQVGGTEVEIIVPASLMPQWRETLMRFGVNVTLCTHTGIRNRRFMADPQRDRLVIVDEAHAFRNPATQRYEALARRSIAARLLLVTATPICNGVSDLHALLALLMPDDALRRCGVPSIDAAHAARDLAAIERVLAEVMIRRDRAILRESLQFGELDRRFVRFPLFSGGGEVARAISSLRFPLVGDHALLRRFLWRRLESSEAALLESIRRQLRFYERARESLAAGRILSKREYRAAFACEEDRSAFQQMLFWELWSPRPATDSIAREVAEEVERLASLQRSVESSSGVKRARLIELCKELDHPAIIFTSAAATARDIGQALSKVARCRIVTARERANAARIFDSFRKGTFDILVCTDFAAEGLDLQRAGVVIHYDLPWNPVILDQRNGRAHRIGQERQVTSAIYFIPESDPSSVVSTVAVKNRLRRSVLTGKQHGHPAGFEHLPPRLIEGSAIVRFVRAFPAISLDIAAERRHKAGVERLIEEMTRERLDEAKVAYLRAVLAAEAPI
ncbi:MAG TPA: DEAD/DEAH box helicase [Thermoanaerobaculia bacterium]|nr:DEAD/DEAH box helicase [Thermoanaerobaculia bacterium]